MSLLPEPCSEERLGELLEFATTADYAMRLAQVPPGELAWLVTEARVAAGLGAELERARREHDETRRVHAEVRAAHRVFAEARRGRLESEAARDDLRVERDRLAAQLMAKREAELAEAKRELELLREKLERERRERRERLALRNGLLASEELGPPYLRDLQIALADHHMDQFGEVPLAIRGMKIGEEAGEVQAALVRHLAERNGRGWLGEVRAEAGDVLIAVICLLSSLGISFEEVLDESAGSFLSRTWDVKRFEGGGS